MLLKRLLILLAIIATALLIYSAFVENTFSKRLSPKEKVTYQLNDVELEVVYNRPSKRDRDIFGALVPFNKVWRTGANEATTFETNTDLMADGMFLPKGTYTIWTVPKETQWTVMFNSKQYDWGVDDELNPLWDPNYDILELETEVVTLDEVIEKFTILFEKNNDQLQLTMSWDKTKIAVPLDIMNK
ncbi:MAG: DUF2911 domain-containing protein [Winogradskyella sp.]|nr:DUF2911 domain-containing protein [Winogradskyella sp.]NNC44993.1 DUF2911 domain-containing protein [Winogradskyella sp.]NNF86180.1 DUF2911 domain-containing protein [Winogradskyella sp.]NNK39621.1 DUF2911 domain-containing protein [Winogradskyella sp.]NNL82627.1 DUF2911 domain-containing protein [Winogradskyella sp.]